MDTMNRSTIDDNMQMRSKEPISRKIQCLKSEVRNIEGRLEGKKVEAALISLSMKQPTATGFILKVSFCFTLC